MSEKLDRIQTIDRKTVKFEIMCEEVIRIEKKSIGFGKIENKVV